MLGYLNFFLSSKASFFLTHSYLCYFQEYHVRTGQGSVSVIVCGDQDKPPLITYPDLALNRKRLELSLCCGFGDDIRFLVSLVIIKLCEITFKWCVFSEFLQICHVFKDYSFSPKQLRCYYITFAFIISVLQDMRSVLLFVFMDNFVCCSWILYSHSFLFGTLPRVLAVRSCWDLSARSFALRRRFSRSNSWGSQLFRVITMPLYFFSTFEYWDERLYSHFEFGFVSFRLGAVMCMGVTAGAYILTLFAVCSLNREVHCEIQYNKKKFLGLTNLFFYSWNIENELLV